MRKHTEGPWCLMPLEDGVEYLRIRGTRLGRRFKVCNVHAPFQHNAAEVLESQANARLIVAAPELLEALETVVADWTAQFERNGHLAPAWCKQARAAIAKATAGAGGADAQEVRG